jgi:methionine-rich copper-binding protein CopC
MSMDIRRSHLALPIVALVLAALALPLTVAAHAELVSASPMDGDTVVGNPPEIHATYSENLDPDGSSLGLYDSTANRVARGGVMPDGGAKEMFIRNLPTLAPGVFTVRSTTRSAEDGDIERVTWSFTVTASAPSATSEPTTAPPTVQPIDNPTTAASATATPAASPSATPATGTSTSGSGDTALPIIAALAIVAIAGVLLVTRGRRTPPVA